MADYGEASLKELESRSGAQETRQIVLEPVARDQRLGILDLAGADLGEERLDRPFEDADVLVLGGDAAAGGTARSVGHDGAEQEDALAGAARRHEERGDRLDRRDLEACLLEGLAPG